MAVNERLDLPIVGAVGARSIETCRWKCGYACFHDAVNRSGNEPFADIVSRGMTRRNFLKATAASMLVLSGVGTLADRAVAQTDSEPRPLRFEPIDPTTADTVVVPRRYDSDVLIRWGDPVLAGAPAFDFDVQTPAAQAGQFGYNCDFVAFFSLPFGSNRSREGLVWVNHEYTNPELMFRGYDAENPTREQVDIQIMAHGGSIVAVRRPPGPGPGGRYELLRDAPWNRRITGETPMRFTGPAAGHPLMQTSEDPTGLDVRGMLNNCAGGWTPWGTILTCEENFHQYFGNLDAVEDKRLQEMHDRIGVPTGESERKWERFHDRFDLAKEPHEPFRFGWVVEIDPYDPTFVPRKHTALGRFKHEGATTRLTSDGRVAVYSGDDEVFEYIYKFVTAAAYDPDGRSRNFDLFEDGTLYAAQFHVDAEGNGVGRWLPLVHGEGPLTPENGFNSQAEVVINARAAADLVGATPMDRPEDVEPSPLTGRVYAALTNNTDRIGPNAANPRAPNRWGHVVEWDEDGGDAAATTFSWRVFLLCGDPEDPTTYFAGFPKDLVSPISSPDNFAFDRHGNLWIATDGQPSFLGHNDAFHATPLAGDERGYVRQFLSVPRGAEACGPEFVPDERTMFCAVQHPGEGGTVEDPVSDWPDGGGRPPRPSLVTLYHKRGRPIGS